MLVRGYEGLKVFFKYFILQMELHVEACSMSRTCIRSSCGGEKDQANAEGH
jgi:hypothetical protein